jgi:hypothetical protein
VILMATKKSQLKSVSKDAKAHSSNGARTAIHVPHKATLLPYGRAICRHFSRVREVDAVFVSLDDDGLVHVYSVVPEYRNNLYGKLLKQERRIEGEFAELNFEFHVRAHQGREVVRAVPFGSQLLFKR